jgi:hypothetical protein
LANRIGTRRSREEKQMNLTSIEGKSLFELMFSEENRLVRFIVVQEFSKMRTVLEKNSSYFSVGDRCDVSR